MKYPDQECSTIFENTSPAGLCRIISRDCNDA